MLRPRITSKIEYIERIGELTSKMVFILWEDEYFLLTGWNGSRSSPMRRVLYVGIERTLTAATLIQTNRYSCGRTQHGRPNHMWVAYQPDGAELGCGMKSGIGRTECREAASETLFRFVSPRCVSVTDLPASTRQAFGIDLSY